MTMYVTWLNAADGVPSYTGQTLRKLETTLASMGTRTVLGKARGGVYLTNPVSGDFKLGPGGTGGSSYKVTAGMAIVPATAAAQGAYAVLSDAEVTGSAPASHATLSRIDLVYLQVKDTDIGDATKEATVGYLQGTAASVPTAPAVPNNAIPLGTITLPPAGGNLQFADARQFLTAPGGVVNTNSSQRATLDVPYGTLAYELDSGKLFVKNQLGAWTLLVDSNPSSWSAIPGVHPNYAQVATAPLQYRKIGDIVYLRGQIQRVASGGQSGVNLSGDFTMFTLPAGARPTQLTQFPMSASLAGDPAPGFQYYGTARVTIQTNGEGVLFGRGAPNWVSLDGIFFFV